MKVVFKPWIIAGVFVMLYLMVIESHADDISNSKRCTKQILYTTSCRRSYLSYYITRTSCSINDLYRDWYYNLDLCTCSWGCYKLIMNSRIKYYNSICSIYTNIKVCCPGESEVDGKCFDGCGNGKFGTNCDRNCTCPDNALDSCEKFSGNCTCKQGWYGQNCTDPCDEGYFGINCENICRCQNGSECDRFTGSCNCTQPGWTGDFCQIECEPDRFGYNCSKECSCGENELCDSIDGECTCKPGWTGHNCTSECEERKYGPDCQLDCVCNWNNTEQCNSTDGTCICFPGKQGMQCNEDCSPGTYGRQCQHNCNCSSAEFCDNRDGSCLLGFCTSGNTNNCLQNSLHLDCFQSENATMDICTEGNFSKGNGEFGQKLIDFCCNKTKTSDLCLVASGTCDCRNGTMGLYCERDCDDWQFGYNCSRACDCDMDNALGCDPVDGECRCSQQWTGKRCTSVSEINQVPAPNQNTPVTTISLSLLMIGVALVIGVIILVITMIKRRGYCMTKANEENINNTETVRGEEGMVYSLAQRIESPNDNTALPCELDEGEYHELNRTGRKLENETSQDAMYSLMMNSENVDENDYSHIVRGRKSNIEDDTYDVTQKCEDEYDTVKRSGQEDSDKTSETRINEMNVYDTN